MTDNKGKFFVGNIKDNSKENGWFYGHFADNLLLQSSLVEVAWQDISEKKAEPSDKHIHKKAVEINIVISGEMRLTINDQPITVSAGNFYIVYPGAVVNQVEADKGTVNICIKAPSVKGDKYYL